MTLTSSPSCLYTRSLGLTSMPSLAPRTRQDKFSTKGRDPGEPIEEFRAVGWTIMSPGNETNLSSVYLTRSSCAAFMY